MAKTATRKTAKAQSSTGRRGRPTVVPVIQEDLKKMMGKHKGVLDTSLQELSASMGHSPTTIHLALNDLVKSGAVSVRRGRPNVYTLKGAKAKGRTATAKAATAAPSRRPKDLRTKAGRAWLAAHPEAKGGKAQVKGSAKGRKTAAGKIDMRTKAGRALAGRSVAKGTAKTTRAKQSAGAGKAVRVTLHAGDTLTVKVA